VYLKWRPSSDGKKVLADRLLITINRRVMKIIESLNDCRGIDMQVSAIDGKFKSITQFNSK